MKKYFFCRPVIIPVIILLSLLASCSKDKALPGPVAGEAALTDSGSVLRVTLQGGSVTGMIIPRNVEIKIAVHNHYFFSDLYYFTRDGHFRFDNVPEGIYTVEITNVRTSAVIQNLHVKVRSGMVTDIGKIIIR